MLDFLKGLAELAASPGGWRAWGGFTVTCALALVLFFELSSPANGVLAALAMVVGAYLSFRWDARSRRRGKIPPAGGWKD